MVDQQTPLVGSGDLLRWQRVDAALLASVNGQAAPSYIDPSGAAFPIVASAASIHLTLAGEDSPSAILLTKEMRAAALIVRTVGAARMSGVRPYLQLLPNDLLIAPTAPNSDVATSIDKIKGMANLPVALKLTNKLG